MLEAAIQHSEEIRGFMLSFCSAGLIATSLFAFFLKRRKWRRKRSPVWWAVGCFVLFLAFFLYLTYGY